MKDFKDKVKALGGDFLDRDHVYYSLGWDWNSAAYMPKYPEHTARDVMITEFFGSGQCVLTAPWSGENGQIRRYGDWDALADDFFPTRLFTKTELKERLMRGEKLEDLLCLSDGQECQIFKYRKFIPGAYVMYVPDISLNHIPVDRPLEENEVEEVWEQCYDGQDFLDLCEGNSQRAKILFDYVDWQHPSSAVDEIWDDDWEEI